jgi:polyhydroxyalkanoate synthase
VKSPVRFVLSTSGHILGIINPPALAAKRSYVVGDASGETDAKAWRDQQTNMPGSWWEDWTVWLHERTGPLRTPPALGQADFPKLCDAPGTYVLES